MATVKIELELDWLNEDENLDETIKKEVIKNLQNRLVANAENQVTAKLNGIIEEMANKVTDSFLEETLKTKIDELKIPYKENSWNSEVKYIPISEFVGMRYERYLNEKTLDVMVESHDVTVTNRYQLVSISSIIISKKN